MVPWERAYLGMGRTFQITRLFREMTVFENVVAPMHSFSWRQLGADAVSGPEAVRAEELLDFVGMADLAAERAGHLSFGQQKLVELAQILMLEPTLILRGSRRRADLFADEQPEPPCGRVQRTSGGNSSSIISSITSRRSL